ncbi:hypothetical protein [Haloechinothrix sp. LS1_15]|nr:hypothetical protein [Haloechinothrix sp. LS1_15]
MTLREGTPRVKDRHTVTVDFPNDHSLRRTHTTVTRLDYDGPSSDF